MLVAAHLGAAADVIDLPGLAAAQDEFDASVVVGDVQPVTNAAPVSVQGVGAMVGERQEVGAALRRGVRGFGIGGPSSVP